MGSTSLLLLHRESLDSLAHAVELTTKLITLGVTLSELALEPMNTLTKLDESRVGLRPALHDAATALTILFLQQAAQFGELVSQVLTSTSFSSSACQCSASARCGAASEPSRLWAANC